MPAPVTIPFEPPAPPPSREALRRRIDDELANLGTLDLSTWMMATAPPPPTLALEDGRSQASEVELDVTLGALLWQWRKRAEHNYCLHVLGPDGSLVAVHQPGTGVVFARTLIAHDDLPDLALHRRPAGAGTAPPGFRQTSLPALLWRFAIFGRNGDQLLPTHYRQLPLRLRQRPPLDHALMARRHVRLMDLFMDQSRTYLELQSLTGLSGNQLSRDLAALMLVGSLIPA